MSDKKMNIELTSEEALVLSAFLYRFNDEKYEGIFEDLAEQKVLWDIECLLERELVEPLRPDYLELLQKARDKIRDKNN